MNQKSRNLNNRSDLENACVRGSREHTTDDRDSEFSYFQKISAKWSRHVQTELETFHLRLTIFSGDDFTRQ